MNRIIGVLWKKEKNGMDYYSGVLKDLRGDIRVAVFPNTYKEKENQPDMNIVLSFTNGTGYANQDGESPTDPPKGKRSKKTQENDDDDDAPF